MKNLKYIIVAFTVLAFNACNELDDLEPTFQENKENVIVNEGSARSILNEIYALSRDSDVFRTAKLQSAMGLSDNDTGTNGVAEISDFVINEPVTDSEAIANSYSGHYATIQQASSFIEALAVTPTNILGNETIKNSLEGEARFIRGLFHFYLLRTFGEFYNTSSDLGIILRMNSAADAIIPKRNTVAECYAAIHEDLDYAILNTANAEKYKASADAAKAIKAKVLLFEGRYAEAAILAAETIAGSSASFPDDYTVNYGILPPIDPRFGVPLGIPLGYTHDSPEVIFAAYTDDERPENAVFTGPVIPGSLYASVARPNPADNTTWDPRSIAKYDFIAGRYAFFRPGRTRPSVASLPSSQIHMRLAELYLIHAEASARVGSGVDTGALASLNTVRTRTAVGLSDANPADKAELLEAIRIEKLLDLWAENGEDFFDLIRYEKEGDLMAVNIKSTMNNKNFYIFPIPRSEFLLLDADNLVQNPGYEKQ